MILFRLKSVYIFPLILLSINLHAQESIDWQETNQKVLEQHILPRYQQLAMASTQLHQRVLADTELCVGFQSGDIQFWQQGFNQLFKSWSGIQHIRFGPIAYLERYDRFHYWPDKHNRGSRQLQQLLTQYDSSLTVEQLKSKSVAIQGLGALEKLLLIGFNKEQLATEKSKICDLIVLITENLQQIAIKNLQAWTDAPVSFAKEFSLAGKSAAVFGSDAEIAKQLLGFIRTQLAVLESLKLGRAFSIVNEKSIVETRVKPKRLEAWRSRQSLASIKENIVAIKEVYDIAFSPHLKTKKQSLHRQIQTSFQRIESVLLTFEKPLYDLLTDTQSDASYKKMMDLIDAVKLLYQKLGNELPQQLNLTISFNALDGD